MMSVWSSKKETIFSDAGTFSLLKTLRSVLVDYLAENTECPFEPPGKLMGGKGAPEVMALHSV